LFLHTGIAWQSDVDEKFKQGPFDPLTMTRYNLDGVYMNHTAEDFIVWMRIAGLPSFLKLRYIVSTPLLKGDVVSINVVHPNTIPTPFQHHSNTILTPF
jgi:hypothetical protein